MWLNLYSPITNHVRQDHKLEVMFAQTLTLENKTIFAFFPIPSVIFDSGVLSEL
jgi:hypothetical protein